jgi:hypothetical protein
MKFKLKLELHRKRQKPIAVFLLCLFLFSNFRGFAFPGGPTQPEAESFKTIGVSEHVNHFNGAFSYTIPLMDVDGFPININYTGSPSLESDASWVGVGWDLNLGSVNRQLRGLPDEFDGSDKMEKFYKVKPNNTYGVKFNFNIQLANFEKLKRSLSLGLSYGIYYNNYRGMKTEISVSPSFNSKSEIADDKTAGKPKTGVKINPSIGISSSSESGLSVTPSIGLSYQSKIHGERERSLGGANIGVPMSAREGIKGLSYGFNLNHKAEKLIRDKNNNWVKGEYDKTALSRGGSISFAAPSTPPFVMNPMENEMYAFTLNGGGDLFTVDLGVGATGNYTTNYVSEPLISRPLYGYFNSEKGVNDENGIMDFDREKDAPYQENIPLIGIPNSSYDLFSVNQPTNSSQFRGYRTTSGVYKDPTVENTTISHSLGGEVHGGGIFEGGATLTENFGGTTSGKWKNSFSNIGDFQNYDPFKDPLKETIIIKSQNELTPTNDELYLSLGRDKAINIGSDKFAFLSFPGTTNHFVDNNNNSYFPKSYPIESDYSILTNTKKFNRGVLFSFLTTHERKGVGLDKQLIDMVTGKDRLIPTNMNYKSNHISEITVTNIDGTRAVYGLPLYNNFSREVNFSVDKNDASKATGLVLYNNEDSKDNASGVDNLYSYDKMPAYPHTWMMTGLLSPDYADLTGDGITDDDRGNAHKINYSLKNPNYVYRMPASNTAKIATYNPGLESDFKDDKASYSEGEREEWYVHSVESKNKIAFLYLEERKDAYGSTAGDGGINLGSKKYCLKQIKLYSKADWKKNGPNAEVIKAVNFEYDYSTCKNAPGTTGGNGKLTLTKIYFSYGKSSRSQSNTYQFEYNNGSYYDYTPKAMDRWGNFKKDAENPNGLANHDFPYSTQDKSKADQNAAAWLIKKIILPSGGQINVNYESHTYGFVQNKRAAYITPILGFGFNKDAIINQNLYTSEEVKLNGLVNKYVTIYKNNNFIFFKFDPNAVPKTVEEMKEMYFYDDQNLEFQNNLYYRCKVNMTERGGTMRKEYVPGYAGINSMGIYKNDKNIGWVELKQMEDEQPVAFSAWQLLKSSNPKLAYPYNDADYTGPVAAIMGMSSFMGNIREMLEGYAKVAKGYNIANTIDASKSYIRLLKPDMIKYGGGARVSKIEISDNWKAMSGAGKTNTYGQEYKYETTHKGKVISSGVAEYEPMMGSDENPFKKPINYAGAKGLFGQTSVYYIDEPVGENFFPSPTIGYSTVKVRSINSAPDAISGSGYQEFEHYTARDFPVKVDRTNLGNNVASISAPFLASFIKVFDYSATYASQGVAVEVNDMHGKPKSEKTFNQKGFKISETNYKYFVDDENKTMPNLVNEVPTIDVDNKISTTLMGVNMDLFNDLRKSATTSTEFSVELGGGMFPLGFLPGFFIVPLGTFGVTKQEYKAASTMKYIHKKGILRRTEKMQDGSKITTENKLWDRNTGDVLATIVQNEFDQPIYSIKMPAYWKYDGMNFAYKNAGTKFSVKLSDAVGTVNDLNANSNMMSILYPGDEVEFAKTFPLAKDEKIEYKKYWVLKDYTTSNKFLIDYNGDKLINSLNNPSSNPTLGILKVVRSGRRNLVTAPLFSSTMLRDPIDNGTSIGLNASKNILNASVQTYSDDWKIISNYKEMVDDSCCNEEKFLKNGNLLFKNNETKLIPIICPSK